MCDRRALLARITTNLNAIPLDALIEILSRRVAAVPTLYREARKAFAQGDVARAKNLFSQAGRAYRLHCEATGKPRPWAAKYAARQAHKAFDPSI